MAAKKGFEDLEPLFGEPTVQWDPESAAYAAAPLRRFLFYAHALDSASLEIVATDFCSLTFGCLLSVHDLEDLRDDIGIGGSWSEFVDYLLSSFSSGDVKLIFNGSQNLDSGTNVKLIALKSKGLPRISLSLNKIMNLAASDAMAKLSLALFEAFKNKHKNVVKEQERSSQLMGVLLSEREKNDSLQKQLDSLSFLSKRKVPKTKSLDKASIGSNSLDNYETALASEIQQLSDIPLLKDPPIVKTSQRAAPVSRRARVRGVSLQDTGDGDDN